ncbi:MAG: hypothetical protein ABIJ08_00925 [Nanoarchaeota archaeon]
MKKIYAMTSAIVAILCLVLGVSGDGADMTVTVGSSGPQVDSVVVANADPTAGSTTQITITTQITDTNGVEDIEEVTAGFTVGSPDNGNNITTMNRGICTDVDGNTIQCIATYNMQFYDPAQTYTIQVYAKDVGGASHTLTDNFAYSSLLALELDADTIAFGSMSVSQTVEKVGDEDMGSTGSATIKNQGNAIIDAQIYATNFAGSTDSFGAGQAEAQFAALGYSVLSNTPGRTETGLDLAIGSSSLENVDFKLTIPTGALPEAYTSTITVNAVANS